MKRWKHGRLGADPAGNTQSVSGNVSSCFRGVSVNEGNASRVFPRCFLSVSAVSERFRTLFPGVSGNVSKCFPLSLGCFQMFPETFPGVSKRFRVFPLMKETHQECFQAFRKRFRAFPSVSETFPGVSKAPFSSGVGLCIWGCVVYAHANCSTQQ